MKMEMDRFGSNEFKIIKYKKLNNTIKPIVIGNG